MAKINAQGRAVTMRDSGHLARVQFLDWLKRTNPDLYTRAMNRAETGLPNARSRYPQMNGLGQTEPAKPSLWERITSSIAQIGSAYSGYKAQSTMLDINLERARAGLPPLDAASMAPVVRTQVDLSPEIAQQLKDAGAAGLNKMLLYGGIAAAAAFMLLKK